MSIRPLSSTERRVLLDALDDYLDVDPEDAAEMEPWLSTAEGLYDVIESGAMTLEEDQDGDR